MLPIRGLREGTAVLDVTDADAALVAPGAVAETADSDEREEEVGAPPELLLLW